MPGLVEGDEVTVSCQICRVGINPTANYGGRVCSGECHQELQWRETLCVTQGKIGQFRGFARYQVDPRRVAAAKTLLGEG